MPRESQEEPRPFLRIEQPPEWWVRQKQEEEKSKEKENKKSGVIIIDMNSVGEKESDRDENGMIVIKM